MKTFQELKIHSALLSALKKMNFETPTPIQAQAIPPALDGADLIGCAQTGTGKTAAFSLPMLERLKKNPHESALILVPTRELAVQVAKTIEDLAAFLPEFRPTIVIGGVPMRAQIKNLGRKPRVVVATPGRLVDHLQSRSANLAKVGVLVLDEADRMLDMGFAPQLNQIYGHLPKERQTMLFSATLAGDAMNLSKKWLRDPVFVQVAPPATVNENISATYKEVPGNEKRMALLDELNARLGSILVFARTKSRTDQVAKYLNSYGVSVARIHGDRSQGQRNQAIDGFRDGSFRVLVATDIAARGIDISHVAHVINFDLPQVAEDYVHRIGRTGRAGKTGEAISFVSPEDRAKWREIERLVKSKKGTVTRVSGAPSSAKTGAPAARSAAPAQARAVPASQNRPADARPMARVTAEPLEPRSSQPRTQRSSAQARAAQSQGRGAPHAPAPKSTHAPKSAPRGAESRGRAPRERIFLQRRDA